jgi:hypothetical protein
MVLQTGDVSHYREKDTFQTTYRRFKTSRYIQRLIHVEVALEDPLLHSIGNLGLRDLAGRWLHYCDTLSTLVCWSRRTQHSARAGDGASLGSRSEVLSEIVTFAC